MQKEERRKGGREDHRMDWAGLGVLGDGSMMACGGSEMEESSDTVRKCMYVCMLSEL